MRIAIVGSLDFTEDIKKTADALEAAGHTTVIPYGARLILSGKTTAAEIRAAGSAQKAEADVIRYYYGEIRQSDALLVLNYAKKGIEHYVGANTFLEIGFAHVLDKKIFLLNPIPDMEYLQDELEAMRPVILHGDLSLLV
ncbi:MAG: hypothetical protein HYS45_00695 [Parcubacteria group bacterium]|nr:hypothetical protein [Parcubacteria group bacterium]